MNILKILGVVLVAGCILTFGDEIAEQYSIPGAQYLVPSAQAIIGRPLTPVSYAGVARRTVRRCAVGMYCSLPESPTTDSLLGQIRSESKDVKSYQAASS